MMIDRFLLIAILVSSLVFGCEARIKTNTVNTSQSIVDQDDPPSVIVTEEETPSITYENPSVVISSTESGSTDLYRIPMTVTFSDSVTNFSSSDIQINGGTVVQFIGSGSSYSFYLVPNTSGLITVDIDAAAADGIGKPSLAASQFSIMSSQVKFSAKLVGRTDTPAPDRFLRESAYFGYSIAISEDGLTKVVGARYDDLDHNNENYVSRAGAAFVYVWNGSEWVLQQKLVASSRVADDSFGNSVGIFGTGDNATIVVGAFLQDSDAAGGGTLVNGAGAAYVFTRSGASWSQQQKLVASSKVASEQPEEAPLLLSMVRMMLQEH